MKRLWVQQTLVFSLVVFVTMGAIVTWINQKANREFRKYLTLDTMRTWDNDHQVQQFSQKLTEYYQQDDSWDGVNSLLAKGVYLSKDGIDLVLELTDREWLDMKEKSSLLEIMLVDVNRRVLFDSARKANRKFLSDTEMANAWPISDADNVNVIGYVLPFYVTGPLDKQQQLFLDRVAQVLLVNTALAVALIVVAGALLNRRLNAPLQHLVDAVQAVTAGNLEQQVTVTGSVEIAQVGQAFNEMTSALKNAEILRQNMVADVAHELRTPLSILQGNLWAILNDAYPLEKAEISRLYDETRLLSRLVEDLRDLALADAGQLHLDLQPTDMNQLIHHTVASFALAAEAQDVELTAQLPDMIPQVCGDADRIAQVLRNLLVNAIRHTPSGGSVVIKALVQDEMLEIFITDTGEGIALEQITHVFERFWRADPSRSRSNDDGESHLASGTGLGLAVAQSLVVVQGGSIWVESISDTGTTFTFTLPLAKPNIF